MKHNAEFTIPNMTDHDAMSDIAIDDINENGSSQESEVNEEMNFETYENEAEYVSPDEVTPETAAEIKQLKRVSRLGGAAYRISSLFH